MIVNVHKILYHTTAEGFGHRACIWFQGCSRHCKGCMAKDTWDAECGIKMDTESILQRIFLEASIPGVVFADREQSKNMVGIEGVTFLGGEPFEQPEALLELTSRVKEKELSVMVFTGYTIEQLQTLGNPTINRCLKNIDLLIDGAYIEEKRDLSRPWTGSSNQRYLFLTNRYSEEDLRLQKNRVEIRVSKDGKITINGMADFEKVVSKGLCDNNAM